MSLARYLEILGESGIKPTIVPCKPGSKIPAVRWAPRNSEFADGTIVADRADTTARVILTGVRSTNLVVLDVDTKHDGFAHFEGLENTLGPLPDTLTVRSPTGGLHLYFRHPAAFRSVGNVNKITGVDVRGEGGVAVCPGSKHPTALGVYVIEAERAIAMLPPRWADWLPRARTGAEPVETTYQVVEPSELRDRLKETAKGRQGDGWAAWRRCAQGERMFRIEGGPGADNLPIVRGVDEFVSKAMIWPLAHAEGWSSVDAESFVRLVDPAFATLRADAAALGQVSKQTRDALLGKWSTATEKAQADQAQAAAFVTRMIEQAKAARDPANLAPILQFDRKYLVLDDRADDHPRYTELLSAEGVPLMCRTLWGDRRVTEVPDKSGIRPMTTSELLDAFGRPIENLILDYTRTTPMIEDLSLVRGPWRLPLPEPINDPSVAEWLELLDPSGGLHDWIAWASPERALVTVPALTMVGDAHVGKSLLADAIARAAGLRAAEPLSRALGRFNAAIAMSPILFSDEGLPRKDNGQPQTEEFRQLITRVDHSCELKGSDKRMIVRGGVRVVLAANRLDRLFSNRGNMGSADVAAIVRRLFVVEITGQRALEAMLRARGLGRTEGDPVRLARVASHCRYLQVTRELGDEMAPRAGSVTSELRRGSDLMVRALAVLEDLAGTVGWIKLDKAHGLVWVQFVPWARAADVETGPLGRACEPYTASPTTRYSQDPITGATLERPERWAALNLERLNNDGVTL